MNCAISSLGAVSGLRLGPAVRLRMVRRLVLEVITEAVMAARAEGVTLSPISGTLDLDWLALTSDERDRGIRLSLVLKHALLLLVGFKYRRIRSSTLRALERGRKPSVEFLNGEITSRAQRFGFDAPVNRALQTTIHAIAAGEAAPSRDTLRSLYEATRA